METRARSTAPTTSPTSRPTRPSTRPWPPPWYDALTLLKPLIATTDWPLLAVKLQLLPLVVSSYAEASRRRPCHSGHATDLFVLSVLHISPVLEVLWYIYVYMLYLYDIYMYIHGVPRLICTLMSACGAADSAAPHHHRNDFRHLVVVVMMVSTQKQGK